MNKLSLTAFVALTLAVSGNTVQAASDILIGPTGTEADINNPDGLWQNNWGPAFLDITFDPSTPPPSGDVQGSVYFQGDWTGNTNGWDQFNVAIVGNDYYHDGAPYFNGNDYQSIELDFKFDTASTMTPASAMHMEIGLDTFYSMHTLTNLVLSGDIIDGAWHHLSIPIPASQPGVSSAYAVGFYSWNPAGTIGTMNMWWANVALIARNVPIPPPTVALKKTIPGLIQFADTTPTYNRQNVRTINGVDASWYGRTKPVSYSFTIAEFPPASIGGFIAEMNICPDPMPQNFADPDWTAASDVFLNITSQGDGTCIAGCYFKTNAPISNAMYNPPDAALGMMGPRITNSTAVGTWTLTFTSDTTATLTAPGGATASLSMPADAAALFNAPCSFYFGSSMGGAAGLGQSITFSQVVLSGTATPVNNNLTTASLDSNLELISQHYNEGGPWTNNPPNQKFITSNDRYWFYWNLPDNGFSAIVTPDLATGPQSDLDASGIFVNGSEHWMKLTSSDTPANRGFYELIKRPFTQLQVLWPGETNAPGMPGGKIGTPTTVSLGAGGISTVTVNACDATFHIVNVSGNSIDLLPSDTLGNEIPQTTPVTLVGGTASTAVLFNAEGSYTMTATNLTDPAILSDTSSSITVGP